MGLILKDVRRGRGALNHLILTFVLRNDPSSGLQSLPGVFSLGGSMAEWFRAMDMKSRLDCQPLFWKGARAPPPNSRLDSWTLALLISTNKISSCLNRAGCINYLSRSSTEVVRYEKRSR